MLDFLLYIGYNLICFADVVELADMPDLGSGAFGVQVQVLSSAPKIERTRRVRSIFRYKSKDLNLKKVFA